ncbi:MAG: Ig-like domain-containing protein [Treponema sp.]|nr:Ig-like domain-containing protein [Treponema sp.]
MKKFGKSFISFLMILNLFVLGFMGCSSSTEDDKEEIPEKNPTIALNTTSVKLIEGATATLTVTYTDIETANQKVTWVSSDTSIATVDSSGKITAVKAGNTTITATYSDTVKATCAVTVEAAQAEITNEILWNASDYEVDTYTTETVFGNITLIASSKTAIDANSKTIDEIAFTKRLKLGGTGSTSSAALKFTTTGKSDITVYCASSSSDETTGTGRMLVLATADSVINNTNEAPLSAGKLVYSDVPAGTYYLYSSSSGINIYGIKIAYEGSSSSEPVIMPSGISLSESTLTFDLSNSETEKTLEATLSPTTITAGYDGITWSSSDESVATVKNGVVTVYKAGNATITATTVYGAVSASCVITVTGEIEKAIRVTDVPTGWASTSANSSFGGNGKTVYTVSSRSDLISKATTGNCIIYVEGMIDMTEGMLPSSGTTSTTKLDEFIANKTSGQKITASSYAEWKTKYAANVVSAEDESGDIATVRKVLQNAWKTQIQLVIGSNTTIIGLGENSGIKGGTISIKDASNIALRNLNIQDAFDPFPHMEGGDGYNAEWDGIVIDNSKNIWIDHCTFEDTICLKDEDLDKVTPSDGETGKNKWQTYDGLLDVKKASDYVTISYCLFKNHDKTSIIGSGDGETGDEGHLTVTFNNNYYLNCTQRLPRVRFGKVHAYNNYYTTDGNGRSNSYCFGVGYNAKIYSEANYFGASVGSASKMMDNSKPGKIYSTGDYNYTGVSSSSVDWTPSYTYTPLSAAEAKADVTENAGAGKLSVIK